MLKYWKLKWAVVTVAALSSLVLVNQAFAEGQKYCYIVRGVLDRDQCWIQREPRKYFKVADNGSVTTQWARTMNGLIVKDGRVFRGNSEGFNISGSSVPVGAPDLKSNSIRAVD